MRAGRGQLTLAERSRAPANRLPTGGWLRRGDLRAMWSRGVAAESPLWDQDAAYGGADVVAGPVPLAAGGTSHQQVRRVLR